DLDHTTPWPGGSTSPGNLVSLCRRHHRMKQHGRWCYTLHDNGDITWTSSTGTTRHTHPAHRVIPSPGPRREPISGSVHVPEPAPVATTLATASVRAAGSPRVRDLSPVPDPPPF
ncbi:MAG: HNH endonuclease, partial [Dermatophilaceae bacterium]